ncbi:hypothetical protein [Streptomyces sp. NBC_01264]|uniref:hypothetical protein n=1 Tax=Streptomyces sp. NBC_01264 TaxID=2903804 RepID=UPI002258F8C3|nr:hypothetical protein [Streptomyces sp. NBC_01264]MCX4783924.1 hypothetical protein [Streptomyces sp. NBC_01264]
MTNDLTAAMAGLTVGSHITVHGGDTRGYDVIRAGYLLAPPDAKKITYNGASIAGWRVRVGAHGADPDDRATWVSLTPERGIIRHTPEPDMSQWQQGPVTTAGARRDRHDLHIVFGGQVYRGATEPIEETPVLVVYTGESVYEFIDPNTRELHFKCRSGKDIWWRPLRPAPTPSN